MDEKLGAGIPWYKEEDFDRIKEVLGYPNSIPATYEQWLAKVHEVIRRGESQGHVFIKVTIDPEEFIHWCDSKHLTACRESQNLFARDEAMRKFDHRN